MTRQRRPGIALMGVVIALVALAAGLAASQAASVPRTFAASAAVTDTATTLSFGFDATAVVVVNDGPSTVFVDFAGPATTADFELKAGESLSIGLLTRAGTLSLVCNSGQTATVRVWAVQ